MTSLTDAAETRTLAWLLGQATTAPTLPLMVRAMTANGSDSAAGTEIAGGTYAPVELDAANVASGASSNEAIVRFEGIPNPTSVAGIEIWDSAGTPFRWWHGAFTGGAKNVTDGVLEIAVGDLDLAVT
ncbi:hypothetical protein GCM10009557_05920 [Virgisporangium ochraceum]|uniref:Uncharacterized protein n=1 Tax=Virgisporangium ochraceum TaxID=65505 RepID=A0A8J4E9A8_9ACTN|nr:hypothetical protein [Virgisporangium ochraceum]GIJ66249.1 hypothetical protein Voc01_011660 [Virgisporangium ochraceum]